MGYGLYQSRLYPILLVEGYRMSSYIPYNYNDHYK